MITSEMRQDIYPYYLAVGQNIQGVSLFSAYKFKNSWLLHKLPDQYLLEPSDDGGDHEKYMFPCFDFENPELGKAGHVVGW